MIGMEVLLKRAYRYPDFLFRLLTILVEFIAEHFEMRAFIQLISIRRQPVAENVFEEGRRVAGQAFVGEDGIEAGRDMQVFHTIGEEACFAHFHSRPFVEQLIRMKSAEEAGRVNLNGIQVTADAVSDLFFAGHKAAPEICGGIPREGHAEA